MFRDEFEKQNELQVLKIKNIKRFNVLKTEKGDYYLTSVHIPWYGIYNFLLPVNKRYAMKLKEEELSKLELIDTDYTSNNKDFALLGLFGISFIFLQILDVLIKEMFRGYSYLAAILIGIVLGIVIDWLLTLRETRKFTSLYFTITYTYKLKVRSNKWFRNCFLPLVFLTVYPLCTLAGFKNGLSTTIAQEIIFFYLFYGTLGEMKTIHEIGPNVYGGLNRVRKWGKSEKLDFETSELLSVEKIKR
ncbi:hypothetical protein Q2T76_01945 [Lactobacillus sp. YT155]|uniref:hypothetical protein n=1 Tax=Lactobacillus sp. YT155 TaxID=3060955 RepID=UPI00265E7E42|nr:hypothetical protein [Lactobacillus sp. YT155]MDO1604811.1 hypothetical protein [Lactobacillus sp. YT155]